MSLELGKAITCLSRGFLVSCDALRVGQQDWELNSQQATVRLQSAAISPSVSCQISCQPSVGRLPSATRCHVRSYRGTS